MEEVSLEDVLKQFPHLDNPEITLENAMINDKTLCVMLNIKMEVLIDIVDNQGWQCVFDRGVGAEEEIFTCLARQK